MPAIILFIFIYVFVSDKTPISQQSKRTQKYINAYTQHFTGWELVGALSQYRRDTNTETKYQQLLHSVIEI